MAHVRSIRSRETFRLSRTSPDQEMTVRGLNEENESLQWTSDDDCPSLLDDFEFLENCFDEEDLVPSVSEDEGDLGDEERDRSGNKENVPSHFTDDDLLPPTSVPLDLFAAFESALIPQDTSDEEDGLLRVDACTDPVDDEVQAFILFERGILVRDQLDDEDECGQGEAGTPPPLVISSLVTNKRERSPPSRKEEEPSPSSKRRKTRKTTDWVREDPETLQRAIAAHIHGGLTYTKVATRFGVSRRTLRRYVKKQRALGANVCAVASSMRERQRRGPRNVTSFRHPENRDRLRDAIQEVLSTGRIPRLVASDRGLNERTLSRYVRSARQLRNVQADERTTRAGRDQSESLFDFNMEDILRLADEFDLPDLE